MIGSQCFMHCSSLTTAIFEINSKLSCLGKRVFFGSGLLSIHIPESVQAIRERCFYSCESLASVMFDSHAKLWQIEGDAFVGTALKNLAIPHSVRFFAGSVLSGLKQLALSFSGQSATYCIRDSFV
jgi:hypothetical protein